MLLVCNSSMQYTQILAVQYKASWITNDNHPWPCARCVPSVLIDAILRNGFTGSPPEDQVPPPSGWRDQDFGPRDGEGGGGGGGGVSGDEKKSYTEEQRQGVHRCALQPRMHTHTQTHTQTAHKHTHTLTHTDTNTHRIYVTLSEPFGKCDKPFSMVWGSEQ